MFIVLATEKAIYARYITVSIIARLGLFTTYINFKFTEKNMDIGIFFLM